MYTMKMKQSAIPIKLTPQIKDEIKAEILISKRAEEYAYEEIKEKLERVKNVRRI